MAGIPFKACILGGAGGGDVAVQVGVVARNYKNFREQLQMKYGLEKDFQVFLEDGTQVCDEEYFDVLEPQTKLTVVQRGVNRARGAATLSVYVCIHCFTFMVLIRSSMKFNSMHVSVAFFFFIIGYSSIMNTLIVIYG